MHGNGRNFMGLLPMSDFTLGAARKAQHAPTKPLCEPLPDSTPTVDLTLPENALQAIWHRLVHPPVRRIEKQTLRKNREIQHSNHR